MGLGRFDGEQISWLYEDQLQNTPSGGSFGFRSILKDKDGLYWINNSKYRYNIKSTNTIRNGISYIDYERKKGVAFINGDNEPFYPFFMSMVEDDEGNLWGATYESGVYKYDGKKLMHYPVKIGDKEVYLFAIYKDKQGNLWLGSHNAGALKFNGKTFEPFKI